VAPLLDPDRVAEKSCKRVRRHHLGKLTSREPSRASIEEAWGLQDASPRGFPSSLEGEKTDGMHSSEKLRGKEEEEIISMVS